MMNLCATKFNCNNDAYVKQKIREKINRTTVTVCMVNELTHTSRWVDWELEQSYEKGNTMHGP